MKRIAFVVSGKSPITEPGGLGAYSLHIAGALKKLGYEVYLLGYGPRAETLSQDWGTLIHLKNPIKKLLGFGAPLLTSLFVEPMKAIIEREKPTDVVVYSAGLWGGAGVKLKQLYTGTPLHIKTLVGYFSTYKHEYRGQVLGAPVADYGWRVPLMLRGLQLATRFFHTPIEHRMLKNSDCIIVHYESTKHILLDEIPSLHAEKIIKIPYFIDLYSRKSSTSFSTPEKDANSVPVISAICRQDPRKGLNTLLKAVKILKTRGIRFKCQIAGSGILLKENKKLAEKLDVMDVVTFLGFVPSVESVLESTDIYVLPSVEEGSGAISLLEAIKKGVAIVTTFCDGIPEDFIQWETGYLVPPQKEEELANALGKLILDPKLRAKLGANAKAYYAKKFTLEKMNNGLAHVLAELSKEETSERAFLRMARS